MSKSEFGIHFNHLKLQFKRHRSLKEVIRCGYMDTTTGIQLTGEAVTLMFQEIDK